MTETDITCASLMTAADIRSTASDPNAVDRNHGGSAVMRVFVTGASGHIGSAVVPELIAAGHQVTGLARSESSAAVVSAAGATPLPGTIDDLDLLRSAAADADGVIHLAFKHEAMRSGDLHGAAGADLSAIEAMLDALAGTGKPFVGTSGTLLLALAGLGRTGTET